MRNLPTPSKMWQACLDRDASCDGLFVTAVKSTGIFCRPSCPARKPKRENVEFFPSPQEAMLAGYRACLRCRPMDMDGSPPAWVQHLLDLTERSSGSRLTDADLRREGIEPARARRYFKTHYGMTFQAYQRSRRLGTALGHLRRGGSELRVGLEHGFDSASGFRDAFARLFGAPPGRGRVIDPLMIQWVDTPVGPFIAGATERGVCLFEFADRRGLETRIQTVRETFRQPAVPGTNTHLDEL
ncbi:MAG: bifunctional transcriptional activator/DNA repair enzyme AdaA, partial [Planctomycetota bacterium]